MKSNLTASASRWRAVAIGFAVLLIGLIAWDGTDRRAADATRPMPAGTSSFRQPPSTLRLASFNIHGGKGSDGVRNLPRIAELLSDHDFVGLYEVRGPSTGSSGNQAALLADRCQAAWMFAPTERQWWSDHFGNGLLYHIPVRSVVRVPLVNTRGKAYRNAILSTVTLSNADVRILSVHIDRENDRRSQLATVIDLFLGLQKPCVLMGDLNTIASDPLLVSLMESPESSGSLPSQNIDWMFTRGLRTISAKLVENQASDHPLLQAELAVEEPTL